MEAEFAKADVIVEREFRNPMFHQGYIEPHASTAFWNNDGNVTIWTTTQAPFPVRQQVCDIVGLQPAKVKVVPTEIGGGFGGKTLVYEARRRLLSRKSGKPVKLQMDRTEVFEGTGPSVGDVDSRQGRGYERRQDCCGRSHARLRSGRLRGIAGRRRRPVHVHAL